MNGFGSVFCKFRRNQRRLQLRSYRCRKRQCGGFCVSVWCLNLTASTGYNCRMRIIGAGLISVYSYKTTDITPCYFFLGGYVNDRVFVPPLPRDLAALKARVTVAAQNTDAPMLTRVWQELEYPIDVRRVTCGAQIELLSCRKKVFFSFLVVVNNSIKVGPCFFEKYANMNIQEIPSSGRRVNSIQTDGKT